MSSLVKLFNNQIICCECNQPLRVNNYYKYCAVDNCRKYSIYYKPVLYELSDLPYVEECRELTGIEITMTYIIDKDTTYFHPLYKQNGDINNLDNFFDKKEILFSLSGRMLYHSDVITICQNGKIMS